MLNSLALSEPRPYTINSCILPVRRRPARFHLLLAGFSFGRP
jgi:hypothetical protein